MGVPELCSQEFSPLGLTEMKLPVVLVRALLGTASAHRLCKSVPPQASPQAPPLEKESPHTFPGCVQNIPTPAGSPYAATPWISVA